MIIILSCFAIFNESDWLQCIQKPHRYILLLYDVMLLCFEPISAFIDILSLLKGFGKFIGSAQAGFSFRLSFMLFKVL